MDPDLYNKCEEEYDHSCAEQQHQSEVRQQRWKMLQQTANQTRSNSSPETNHVNTLGSMPLDSVLRVPERILEEFDLGSFDDLTSLSH
jgi:hypothetical protein